MTLRLARIGQLCGGFFAASGENRGRLMLGGALLLIFLQVWINVQMNSWNADFFNALQARDIDGFRHQLLRWTFLITLLVATIVYQGYLKQGGQISWRLWMTRQLIELWLDQHRYADIEGVATKNPTSRLPDNPDQRISEDARDFTGQTVDIFFGLIQTGISLSAFSSILWGLSANIPFFGWSIHGGLVYACFAYAAVGSLLSHWVGKPLARLNFNQQAFEANFRYALVRIRENSPGIRAHRVEALESGILRSRLQSVIDNLWIINRQQKLLGFFSISYGQAITIVAYLFMAPRYFGGHIGIGQVVQTVSAAQIVLGSLSWLVNSYGSLATWWATTDRLLRFHDVLQESTSTMDPGARVVVGGNELRMQAVVLRPNQRIDIGLKAGERMLIIGQDGSGKTSLVRAINRSLTPLDGLVCLPEAMMHVAPQPPYLPLGTIRELMLQGSPAECVPDQEIIAALQEVGLDSLIGCLNESANWMLRLSVGETNRLVIGRVLIQRPNWIILDEPCSGLDPKIGDQLLSLLSTRLPTSGMVVTSRTETHAPWADQIFHLQ